MIVPIITRRRFICVAAVLMMTVVCLMPPGDEKAEPSWPMFGGSPGRNMVNAVERDIPADWCIKEAKRNNVKWLADLSDFLSQVVGYSPSPQRKNVKWIAELGNRALGSPVVAHGKVFVATNNAKPRDPEVKGRKPVLMAFRESDGQFLWQIAHDVPANWDGGTGFDGGSGAACPSTPVVAGRQLYYIAAPCNVICADADNGKIQWRYDMMKELQVHLYSAWCMTPALSSPLVIGDLVFVITGNGLNGEGTLVSPRAPSFIALDKRTGKLVWQSNLPGENVIEGQWSSPTFADVAGMPQVIFAGGDGVIYSFAPQMGNLLWKCDCLPTRKKKGDERIDNYFVGTPVVLEDKLYVGLGRAPEHPGGSRWSHFLCLDITKKGDVSLKSYDAKSPENKGSALVWTFGGPIEPRREKGRRVFFDRTVSTAAVHEGLVYITEENGYLHCLDAATGRRFWEYDFMTSVVGSPYWVDGRVFVGAEDGQVLIFAHGRTAKLLAKIDMEDRICTTPVAVNGTLYVATGSKLFAIASR